MELPEPAAAGAQDQQVVQESAAVTAAAAEEEGTPPPPAALAPAAAGAEEEEEGDDEEEAEEESDDGDMKVLCVDIGSGVLRAGWAGDDAPCCVVPAMVACPAHSEDLERWYTAEKLLTGERQRVLEACGGLRRLLQSRKRLAWAQVSHHRLAARVAGCDNDVLACVSAWLDKVSSHSGSTKDKIARMEDARVADESVARMAIERYRGTRIPESFADPHGESIVTDSASRFCRVVEPIRSGMVWDWTLMERIWRHTFWNELRVDPAKQFVMATEKPLTPIASRELLVEMLFDRLHLTAVHVVIESVVALFSNGRTTGLVLDSGDAVTHAVPIYEGHHLPHAVTRLDLGGLHVTQHLARLLSEVGVPFTTCSGEMDYLQMAKEKHACVAADCQAADLKSWQQRSEQVTLPNGVSFAMRDERFRCAEIMFQPTIVGLEHAMGLPALCHHAILACDVDVRQKHFRYPLVVRVALSPD
jgi:actin-related protein